MTSSSLGSASSKSASTGICSCWPARLSLDVAGQQVAGANVTVLVLIVRSVFAAGHTSTARKAAYHDSSPRALGISRNLQLFSWEGATVRLPTVVRWWWRNHAVACVLLAVITVPSTKMVNDPPRTRTWNLRLRRPTPYPLGQRADYQTSRLRSADIQPAGRASFQ